MTWCVLYGWLGTTLQLCCKELKRTRSPLLECSLPASAFSSVVLPPPGGPSSSIMRPCSAWRAPDVSVCMICEVGCAPACMACRHCPDVLTSEADFA